MGLPSPGRSTLPEIRNVPNEGLSLNKFPLPAAIALIWKLLKRIWSMLLGLPSVLMVTVMAEVVQVKELIVMSLGANPLVTVGPIAVLNSNPVGKVRIRVLLA